MEKTPTNKAVIEKKQSKELERNINTNVFNKNSMKSAIVEKLEQLHKE